MSLKHAILAVLSYRDRTGYELTKKIEGSVANFWPATHQQIYFELKKLSELGLVSFRDKEQKSRPDKKVYSLTQPGKKELKRWADIPLEAPATKDALLIKVFANQVIDKNALLQEFNHLLEIHGAKLEEYKKIEREHFKGKIPQTQIGQYLALRRGILFEKTWIEWANECVAALF